MRKVHFQAIAIAFFALLFLQGPASGTPPTRTIDANVINTPDVEVINDSTNPVPVTVIKEQRMPFQTYVSCRPTGSYWYGCDTLSTQEDARLVIEQVGISFVPNDPTTEVAGVELQTRASGVSVTHGIQPPAANTFRGTFTVQRGSQLTKIYADAGSDIWFKVLINKTDTPMNEQHVIITLSGIEIDE